MGLKVGTVILEPYKEDWLEDFKQEKNNLENILNGRALSIEHIGSTSIPGLSAKPIIDIAVGLNKLTDFELIKEDFKSLPEYSIKEDSDPGEWLVRKGPEENRTHFIHFMEHESLRYKEAILFRDYLINHSEVREEYEKLKNSLYKKYFNNRKEYTASKNDFIRDVLEKAKSENN